MVKWNLSGTYWCFFCPFFQDPIGFWPRLPDERLRIISKADLIYVLCRWGHPNDLPRHGRHQSPPTRGHSRHAWERELGGTPNTHRAVYVWAHVHILCTNVCSVNVCVCMNVCTWECDSGFVCLIMCLYWVGGILCVFVCVSICQHIKNV